MLNKFNKMYKKLVNQSALYFDLDNFAKTASQANPKLVTVTIDSCWSDKEQVQQLKLKFIKYNVLGAFNDGGDQNSSWVLSGKKEDVKKVILKYWLSGLKKSEATEEKLLDVLDQEEYQKLI